MEHLTFNTAGLMLGFLVLSLAALCSLIWLWAGGIDYMKKYHPDYKGMDLFGEEEKTLEETKQQYIEAGVDEDKIITTEAPSLVVYGDRHVSLQIRAELTEQDVKEINESDGIIVTNQVYGKPHFRYGFIPKNRSL